MKDEGAGKGRSQKEQSPGLRMIRRGIRDLGESISTLTPKQVRETARANGVNYLMYLQNGGLGGRFYELVSQIDSERFSPVAIVNLSNLFTDRVLVPFGCLERRLGGDGALACQWSEEVALLGFPGDDGDDGEKRRVFIESVAERIGVKQVALTSSG